MKTVRFIYGELGGYRLVLALSMTMAVVQVTADILSAFPLKFVLDKVVDRRNPGQPWRPLLDWVAQAANGGRSGPPGLVAVIVFSALLAVAFGALSAAASYGQLYAARTVGQNVSAGLRSRLFRHLIGLPLDWHGRRTTGDLVQRLTGNVADLEKLMTDGLVDLLAGLLTLVGIVAVMAAFNWRFTLLSVVVVPTLFVVIWSYTRRIKLTTRRAARAAGRISDVAAEDVRAITEVKAMALEHRESARFFVQVRRYRAWGLRAGRLQAEFQPLVALILAVSTFTIVGVGSLVATGHPFRIWFWAIPAGSLSIGTLTVFLVYVKQLYQPMRDLSKLMYLASNAGAGVDRIQELLAEPEEPAEPGIGVPAALIRSDRLHGSIAYEGAVFGYRPQTPVIRGVDLRLEPGQRVALVGRSGSGKTTLVKLIPRFYLPWRGRILLDGADNRAYPLEQLRRNVAFVMQDPILFGGSVRDNIAVARPEAGDRQVLQAARVAQIDEDIRRLPEGYDSPVEELGKNFSAGQRQRLAIARAVLQDAPILVLDEPTANLDVEAEAEVMQAIQGLVRDRTVITISHRLSTLGAVDRILVLQDGRLVEEGDFKALRRMKQGVFASLYEAQHRYSPEVMLERRPPGPAVAVVNGGGANGGGPGLVPTAEASHRLAPATGNGRSADDGGDFPPPPLARRLAAGLLRHPRARPGPPGLRLAAAILGGAVVATLAFGLAFTLATRSAAPAAYQRVATIPWRPAAPASVDIAWADPASRTYWLADRSNAAVHVVDLDSNRELGQIQGFAGKHGKSVTAGPNGLVYLPDRHELWVGDGDGSLKVVAAGSRAITAVVPTGASTRVDELAYDARRGLVAATVPDAAPPRLVLLSAAERGVVGEVSFPDAAGGVEQPVWNAADGDLYLALTSRRNPGGEIDVIDPDRLQVARVIRLPACNPRGLAFGPAQHLLVGCGVDAMRAGGRASTLVLDAPSGGVLATLRQVGGSDQVWYDPGAGRYYAAASDMTSDGTVHGAPRPVLGIIDAGDDRWLTNLPTSRLSHSVAVDQRTGRVLVPLAGAGIGVYAPAA